MEKAVEKEIKIDFELLTSIESNKKLLDINYMDRTEAILIYKGKVYEDTNHQYAFKQAIEDEGLVYQWDIENDITHENKAANETYELSKNQEIYTFSVFQDENSDYLIAHFENHLNDCLFLLEEYLKKGYKLGSFKDMENDECYVFEKINYRDVD